MSQLTMNLNTGPDVRTVISFHNTIKLSDEQVEEVDAVCKSQEDRIMAIFHQQKKPLTPFELEQLYGQLYHPVPITSIRRALTNLTKIEKLVKSNDADKKGEYGKANHTWRVNV